MNLVSRAISVGLFIAAITYSQTPAVWDGTTNTAWYTPSATTFYIGTAEELAGLETFFGSSNATETFENKTIILTADIMLNDTAATSDCPDCPYWKNWQTTSPKNSWKPIAPYTGSGTTYAKRFFQGTFDGNGHIISGIYLKNSTAASYNGFFGTIGANATIKNLGITASYFEMAADGGITGAGKASAGLVGRNYGKVMNSFSIGTIVVRESSSSYASTIGGLVGIILGGAINNCFSTGPVMEVDGAAITNGGAIVAYNNVNNSVSNSYYDATTSIVEYAIRLGLNADINYGKKNTEEMQNQDFVDALNLNAGILQMNEWELGKFGYPTLKHNIATDPFTGKYASGSGTSASPYMITEAAHLQNLSVLAKDVNLKGYYFKLGDDINLEGTWTAIGTAAKPFNGNFDGNGKTISGISINKTTTDYQGLFGYIGTDGVVNNLGVINSEIKGKNYVGGIAGYNAGTISNSYSTATVNGTNYVGGFVGKNASTINISSNYSTGNVSGTNYVGGFVGENAGTISSSYSTGNVSGAYAGGFVGKNTGSITVGYSTGAVSGTSNVGGFVGSNCETCKIIGAYYQTPNLSEIVAEGKTAAEMKSADFLVELNLIEVVFSTKKWKAGSNGYPILSNEIQTFNLASYFAGGNGTVETPYLISTPKHLDNLSLLVGNGKENFKNKFLKLNNDIALDPLKNFTPIGTLTTLNLTDDIARNSNSFRGTFDGNNNTISHLYINSNVRGTGLFSFVYDGGNIKNLKITNSNVKGKQAVGGLVGMLADSFIENCSFSGTVTAIIGNYEVNGNRLGGLVGMKVGGKIINSHSAGYVTGDNYYVGGLVGFNNGEIVGNYSTSTVTGADRVGGLIGTNYKGTYANVITLENNYSTGTVTGNSEVGGLVGGNGLDGELIEKNFSTSTVKGDGDNVGGLFGSNSARINNCYAIGNVNGNKNVGGLVGYNLQNVSNSYSTGKVMGGTTDVGGLIGKKELSPNITASYYDKTVNGTLPDPDNQGRTTSELKTISTFGEEWDFQAIWGINNTTPLNKGYPYLKGVGEDMLECVSNNSKTWDGSVCRDKTQEELLGSSSSAAIIPSSSSIAIATPSSSSNPVSSSSSNTFVPCVDCCKNFNENETRLHYGKQKKQICDKRDGTKYVWVTIGNQDWLAENLNITHDQCGKSLGRCYGNDPANCDKYGRLYTISEAEADGWKLSEARQVIVEALCPEGWHIPSSSELATMLKSADPAYQEALASTGKGKNEAAIALKAQSGWPSGANGIDKYGFSALPGGYCGGACPGDNFTELGSMSYWWTTSVGAPAPLSITWNINTGYTVNNGMQSYPNSRFYARCMRNHGEAVVPQPSNKCASSQPNYDGFSDAVKETYPDLTENIDPPPSNTAPPSTGTTANLPLITMLGNISAHPMHKSIELQNLPGNAKIEVYNLQGRHIYFGNSGYSPILKIQVQTGMYIVKISLGSEAKILRVPVI